MKLIDVFPRVSVLFLLSAFFANAATVSFVVGDQIQVAGGTFNIRQTPAGTVLGTQATGAVGTVVGGPTVATLNGTSINWFNVNFNTGTDGWISDTGVLAGPNYGTNFSEGFDVYSGNGTITWGPSVAAGEKFVYVKTSEGATFTDSRFATYMPAAKAAGLLVGAYHFAHPLNNTGTNGAVLEAQHFLAVARAFVTNGWLPPVLDVEDEPNGLDPSDPCSDGTNSAGRASLNLVCKLGKTQLSAWVRAWVGEVKRQTGITAALYMNSEYATTGMESDLAACPLWLVYHGTQPPDINPYVVGPWTNSWTFLQYNFNGNLSGIASGPEDLNKFNGDVRALKLFAAQSATTNVLNILTGIGGAKISRPTNGQFQFEVSSAALPQVIVQSSTNIPFWTNIGTVILNHGHVTFTDSNLTSQNRKFYRPHP